LQRAGQIDRAREPDVPASYHPLWEGHPILTVGAHEDAQLTEKMIVDHLTPYIARWWMSDKVIFAPVPLTAIGKIDKKALRTAYGRALAEADDVVTEAR
jgi:hypothetical protein